MFHSGIFSPSYFQNYSINFIYPYTFSLYLFICLFVGVYFYAWMAIRADLIFIIFKC